MAAVTKVRVIAAGGVTIRGPAVLHLSAAQVARRGHVRGATVNKNRFELHAGEVQFKHGETFGIEAADHLNLTEFEVVDAPPNGAARAAGGIAS